MTNALALLLAAAPAWAHVPSGRAMCAGAVLPLRRAPTPLAASRPSRRPSRFFADADADGDGELSASEILAFISRPRILILALGVPAAYLTYLAGSSLLVDALGVNRADSDAFGPFVTLLGPIYTILLSQTYGYYFARQGTIHDALYQEIASLQELATALDTLCDR